METFWESYPASMPRYAMADCQSQARGKMGEHMRSGGWITGSKEGATRLHVVAGVFGVPPLLLPHSAET